MFNYPLQNDISDILDLTFSIDADEEKLILYERAQVCIFWLFTSGTPETSLSVKSVIWLLFHR